MSRRHRYRTAVTWTGDVETATALHADAAKACFIAASVNFPVRHEPTVRVAG
ncbi:hypothetical protein AB0K12_30255 [Nonomuraea sp. NPDC049419]|uniref:hypothetical protein n=1 Tax=Nonomuraea sp. NPDC049419 TaxID=3155772 RepID=UPI003416253F